MALERADPRDQTAEPPPQDLVTERRRLVRLCARLSGDPVVAEDLAQETLLLAWRLRARLSDPSDSEGRFRWLAAIARNICLRWRREHAREATRLAVPSTLESSPAMPDSLADAIPDDVADLELELERDELADLLDRALALLTPGTRDILIARFIHDKPQAEVAARLGVTEDVVAQRLHRGKLTLRRLLMTDLRREAAPYLVALDHPDEPDTIGPMWQDTRIWCPFCGRHRLRAYINRDTGEFAMHCSGNCLGGVNVVGMAIDPALVAGLSSPKSLLTRHCLALSTSYRTRLADGVDVCPCCGGPARVRLGIPEQYIPDPLLTDGIVVECPHCGMLDSATAYHLAIDTPQAVAFWRRHPRMRPLPIRELAYAGRTAILTGFESVCENARLEIVSDRDTWETLHMDEGAAR